MRSGCFLLLLVIIIVALVGGATGRLGAGEVLLILAAVVGTGVAFRFLRPAR
jgi:hypothetical protein